MLFFGVVFGEEGTSEVWYIRVPQKPKSCEQFPLCYSEKWHCGKMTVLNDSISGKRWIKVPDKRCKIQRG